jgi:glutamyl-tRNA reductase
MALAVVGISHKTAPVEVRERMAFGPTEVADALLALRRDCGVEEAVLLSTCNRTEVYLYPAPGGSPLGVVEPLFQGKARGLDRPAREYLFEQRGEGVVQHLFQVSSGLDSMVTGEAEIQGQVRDAYEMANAVPIDPPMAGPVLNRLFQMALSVGGRVRAETSINEGSASVASVSVELARKIFGSLREKRVMILGAGATAELVVEALRREGVQGILVANRTHERGVELAERLRGHAIQFEELPHFLPSADIVLASTAAPHHVLTRDTFRRAFPKKRGRPLLIIDIAIPRDVDPAVGEEAEVFLYNVDDLRRIVEDHVRVRSEAIPEAHRIIQAQSQEFRTWYASLEVVPVIRGMREQAERHRALELERLFRGMEQLGPEERARLEEFSRRLTNKLLHTPSSQLRKGLAHGGGGEALISAFRFLYGLDQISMPGLLGEESAKDSDPGEETE